MRLGDLAILNPWWKGKLSAIESWQKFYDFSFIAKREILDFSKNYIIRGPRQIGKTVFLYRLMNEITNKKIAEPETITYISCDRLGGWGELRNIIKELKEIMRGKPKEKFLFLDEITSIRNWEKVYKEICEEGFFKVIATGSRPKELEKTAEYFPGRNVEIFNFYPLSFREFVESFLFSYLSDGNFGIFKIDRHQHFQKLSEFLKRNQISLNWEIAQNLLKEISNFKIFKVELFKIFPKYFEILNFLFQKYLKTGGYPIAIEKEIKKEELPSDIVIKDTLGTDEKEGLNTEILNRLIPQLLLNLTSKTGYSKLARSLGIDKVTLIKYIETLEKSFILREIHFFDGKIHPKKEKKFYFSDPFLINAFENYYALKEIEEGKIVENIIAENLARWIEDPFRSLWKNQMGYGKEKRREVDFLVKKEGKILKIEVKYKEIPKGFPEKIDFILTKDEFEISQKPHKIPVSIFLLGLT